MDTSTNTIGSCLQELAAGAPDKKLLGSPAGWLTASQIWASAKAIGLQLLAAGIRPGDFLALPAERKPETVLVLLALRIIGAAAILLDPHEEPENALASCETPIAPDGILLCAGCGQFFLQKGRESFVITTAPTEDDSLSITPAADAKGPGYVIFTSGSTGKKKAVVLSDANLISNLLESQPLGCYSEDDIALGILPLEHIFGLVLLAGMAVLHYAVYFPERTDITSILSVISQVHITRMNGVPSLYQAMAENRQGQDLSSLRAGFIGGAPLRPEQFVRLEQELNMILIPVYGMSECIGISCADSHDPSQVRICGVGRVYPGNTVKILDDNQQAVADGSIGEIWVNSPSRMLGYWGAPMAEDAFLATGDIGFLEPDGTLHLTGRKKDIIIRNGRNISPRKIEEVILSLTGVRDAVVLGLPDDHAGEVPFAMVAGIIDPADLKPLLPKNELPAGIMCVDELPMTFSGKPDKVQIREVLSAWRRG